MIHTWICNYINIYDCSKTSKEEQSEYRDKVRVEDQEQNDHRNKRVLEKQTQN